MSIGFEQQVISNRLQRDLNPLRRMMTSSLNTLPIVRWINLLDMGLIAIIIAMGLTDATVLLFYGVFILLVIGASFWPFRDFVIRTVCCVSVNTLYILDTIYAGKIQFKEFITIPILVGFLSIIYRIVRQRAIAEAQVQNLNQDLENRIQDLIRVNRQIKEENAKRLLSEAALRESEERYALATQAANDGLWDWNVQTNTVYYSPRWQTMVGYEIGEIAAEIEAWFSRVHPDDLMQLKQRLLDPENTHETQLNCEYRLRYKDETYGWMLARGVAIYDDYGNLSRLAGSQSDITLRKMAEAKLVHDAFHDGLTGLPNRALFVDRLERSVELQKRRPHYSFVVLFIDLDRFKLINDSLGHACGDQLLSEFAQRISACSRSCDTVSRLGGDEFAILLEDMSSVHEANKFIQRIQATLEVPFYLGDQEIYASASIGVATSRDNYMRPDEALQDADAAMYRAKRRGKGHYEVFDHSMHTHSRLLLQLENDLGRAIERQELQTYYQPIFDLKTERLVGFEALLRWLHPQRGMVSPADFIPIAEETGLIVSIGDWVLRTSCRQMSLWQEQLNIDPKICMSVNLSPRQFTQPNLSQKIDKVLQETNLKPQSLKLEITESVLMENPKLAASILSDLKRLGVQLYLDDFGTGYSSLSYLQNFPVDALKIDQSFIRNLHLENSDAKIVQTIITLAQYLGISVVAEGIEMKEHLTHLKALSCEFGQGYFFEKPINTETAEIFLIKHSLQVQN